MKTNIARFFAFAFVAIALLGATALPARAGIGPADDRQRTDPSGWWTYTGVTVSQIATLLSNRNARLTEIQAESPTTFTVVMIPNTGANQSGWWWYVGQTASQVGSALSSNNARLISAHAYNTSSGIRFATVMVQNTGANNKGWWWYYNASGSFISSQLSANSARLISLSQYPAGGYLAIMVSNTGSNNTGWWWYTNATTAFIGNALSTNHARLVDLSRNSNGSWNAIMYSNPSTRWYWWVGVTPGEAVENANQNGQRIIDATSYFVGGQRRYAVATTENLNGLERKLWGIISPRVDSGAYGFYLKRVGAGILADLQAYTQYEPASALKVLYHAKSIHQQALGVADSRTLTYRYDTTDPNNGGICTNKFTKTKTTDLKTGDTWMMVNSDNRTTRAILELYGSMTTMEDYGESLGLTQTEINHHIGCPTASTYNRTTLVDLGRVYEAFQNGGITRNATWLTQFRSRMLNQNNTNFIQNSVCPIVRQEATSLGKTPAVATNFCNAITWIAKGGSYQYGGSLPWKVSLDNVSMTGLPYKSGGTTVPRFFVFGEYVDQTQINSMTEQSNLNTARDTLYLEAMRPQIRAGLATW